MTLGPSTPPDPVGALAPIAFFAFNRPEHTLRSLRALQANSLAAASTLYFFCDGPRADESAEGLEAIKAVQRAATSEQWCGRVILRFRDENLGLARAIPDGISEVVNQHGRVIVVEDDVVVSPGFLEYVNSALEMYAEDYRVMHVSAYLPPIRVPADYPETTFFYNHTTCWGWGTWRRAWRHFSTNGTQLMREIDQSGRKRYINLDNSHEFYWALKYLDEGRSQDWNCYWHVAVALGGGFCLHPVSSLAENIGFDGSGTQCSSDMPYEAPHLVDRLPIGKIPVVEHREMRARLTRRPWHVKLVLIAKGFARRIIF